MASIAWRGSCAYLSFQSEDPDTGRKRQERISLGRVAPEQAERVRQIKELELKTGIRIDADGAQRLMRSDHVTLSKFYDDRYEPWFARQFPSSIGKLRTCMKHLRKRFGDVEMPRITTLAVEDWKTKRLGEHVCFRRKTADGSYVMEERRPISNETVRKELNTLMAMLRRAVKWKLLQKLPCTEVEPVPKIRGTKPKFLTKDELERVYAVSGDRAHWWRFLANTGLRRSEAFKLRRSLHVQQGRDGALVLAIESDDAGRTKSGRARTVVLNAAAKEALKHLGRDYLFPRIRKDVFGRHFINDARRAGIDSSIHCLRHSYGTHMAAAGVPVHHLQRYMGHANVTTTMMYLWSNNATMESDAESISL